MSTSLWVVSSVALCLQWILVHFSGIHPSPEWLALSAGLAIFGASFMLSWSAELAQLEIPQALALALLALIAVLPEYAVDMYFAWMAGKDPKYTAFATANMTGANRLLIGVGWAAVVFAFWLKTRKNAVILEPHHKIEVLFLGLATLYSFFIPFKGRLDLFDAAIFIAIFVFYMRRASQAEHVEPELEGPAEVMARWRMPVRRFVTVAFFLVSGFTIFIAAEPFAEGLLATGRTLKHLRRQARPNLSRCILATHWHSCLRLASCVSRPSLRWRLRSLIISTSKFGRGCGRGSRRRDSRPRLSRRA